MEQFIDGLLDFLKHSVQDPQNNIGELDKSLRDMLEHKLLCSHNPRAGLMFMKPSAAAHILQHPYLMQLLFYPRVFERKHEWSTCYLSPISRRLCQQSAFCKLPSIYSKYGREIDSSRHIIYLSTIDYFFMSFIAYPVIVGRDIPKILNALYSSYKYEQEMSSHPNSNYFDWFWGSDEVDEIPINPFKHIHLYYAQIFDYYLRLFVPHTPQMHVQRSVQEFSLKFIEIIGELWFGASFSERPIGDRCETLVLMQDVLFIIMRRQIDYQYEYNAMQQQQQQYESSCICPELRCLLRYLYSFFRESFEHFPLDFIANLRIVIEMLCYVLAPWSIDYKLRNPDGNIALQLGENPRRKRKEKSSSWWRWFKKEEEEEGASDLYHRASTAQANDDRLRALNTNNTEFDTAEKLINYELEGIESVALRQWRRYIEEMLPFYSCLIDYFVDSLLKYDFAHPLKQLCVLRVLHIYANHEIVRIIGQTEDVVLNVKQSHTIHKLSILNNIEDITFAPIHDYKAFGSTHNAQAHQLYIKCRKVMLRLSGGDHSIGYFADPHDNVKIIRYIIGELESLFGISPQQRQNLMNVSIMYEPSQSESQSPPPPPTTTDMNIWNRPQGQYESYYALRICCALYTNCIQNNDAINQFYCKYLALYHRRYCVDRRAIGWYAVLTVTYLFCHTLVFCACLVLFVVALLLPYTNII
eukprot:452855_1